MNRYPIALLVIAAAWLTGCTYLTVPPTQTVPPASTETVVAPAPFATATSNNRTPVAGQQTEPLPSELD